MTFRRLFPNTEPAGSLAVARQRVLALYREWLREVPRAVRKYPLDVPIAHARARVRHEFERTRHVAELTLINTLTIKGTMELIETHNKWKQRLHVMSYFDGEWEREAAKAKELPRAALRNASPFLRHFLHK